MPKFFSLSPELRNMIYDILHQHEQADNGHMTFVAPLTHVHNISRRFRNEYENRSAAAASRLVVFQGNWCWGKFTAPRGLNRSSAPVISGPPQDSVQKKLPKGLPELVTMGRRFSYKEVEFNFDVYDEVRKSRDFLEDVDAYSTWVETLLYREHHLPRASCGGEVHLRLFFSYLSTFLSLRRLIERQHWFNVQFSKISLVLYSGGDGVPTKPVFRADGFWLFG